MNNKISTVVLKFGGAAVATPESFSDIAEIIIARKQHFNRIAVVVSAMGDTTDELIELAHKVHPDPPRRELDMMVSVGERISMSLLAMALDKKGCKAISFTGSQSGIITSGSHSDAAIVNVKPHRLLKHLDAGRVVVVAGFQGVSLEGEITTLGRGGSDTTAVALAIALGADKVEFFKDVPGIFDKDPKRFPDARRLSELSYDQALEIVEKGAQVLHNRCIKLAAKNAISLHVLPFNDHTRAEVGTLIVTPDGPRTAETCYEGDALVANSSAT